MNSFTARKDILPPGQLELWPLLEPVRQMGFVLYGGTAIALRLGHRQSIDFDFFTHAVLDKDSLRESLIFLNSSTLLQDEPNTFTVLSSGGVKVSFFGGLGFGRFGRPELTDDEVLLVASLDDLMALKMKVILQRIEAKDYRDVAAMLEAGLSLERGLAIAERMFAPHFAVTPALKALTFFEGGDLCELSQELKETLVSAAASVSSLPNVSRISLDLT